MERIVDINPPLQDKGKELVQLALGFEKGQAFLTALELNIFTLLKESKTVEVLAEELGTDQEITESLLDVLVGLKLLSRQEKKYGIKPEYVPFLVQGEPYYAHNLRLHLGQRKDWINLKHRLQAGPALNRDVKQQYKYNYDNISWMARRNLLGRLQATYKILTDVSGFNTAKKMIDLGGAHGLYGISFAQMNPALQVVIFDQPVITDITKEYISDYGMHHRIEVRTGDYIKDEIGKAYDLVFCALSFNGSKEETLSFYQKVHGALNDEGLFIVQTFILNDDGTGPMLALTQNLRKKMRGEQDKLAFTNKEMQDIFAETGFIVEKVIDMSHYFTLPISTIVVRKTK